LNDKDHIKELFQKKLGNLDTPVDPSLWAGVQAALPATSGIGGLSLLTKLAIGVSAASVITGIVYFTVFRQNPEPAIVNNEKPSQQAQTLEQEDENKQTSDETVGLNSNNSNQQQQKRVEEPKNEVEERMNYEFVPEPFKTPLIPVWEPVKEIIEPEPIQQPAMENGTPEPSPVVTPIIDEPITEDDSQVVKIELPNVFSPNGDNENDFLFLKDYDLRDFQLVVLNKRNQVVYQTNDPQFKWDGSDNVGNPVPVGEYYYMVTAYDVQGKPVNVSNRLTIVR
jgi:gliding motility-associated-like protein